MSPSEPITAVGSCPGLWARTARAAAPRGLAAQARATAAPRSGGRGRSAAPYSMRPEVRRRAAPPVGVIRLEQLIRSYDPCMSCSAHSLDIRIVRD